MAKSKKRKRKKNQPVIKKSRDKALEMVTPVTEDPDTGQLLIDREFTGRKDKISALILEMIQPELLSANGSEEIGGIISLAIIAWNCGIIREITGEEGLAKIIRQPLTNLNASERKLLDEYTNIKCSRYKDYNDYIISYHNEFHGDTLSLTVRTSINEKDLEGLVKRLTAF